VGDITALNIGDTVRLIWQSDGRPMVAAGAAIEDDSELPVSSNTYYEFKEQTPLLTHQRRVWQTI